MPEDVACRVIGVGRGVVGLVVGWSGPARWGWSLGERGAWGWRSSWVVAGEMATDEASCVEDGDVDVEQEEDEELLVVEANLDEEGEG